MMTSSSFEGKNRRSEGKTQVSAHLSDHPTTYVVSRNGVNVSPRTLRQAGPLPEAMVEARRVFTEFSVETELKRRPPATG